MKSLLLLTVTTLSLLTFACDGMKSNEPASPSAPAPAPVCYSPTQNLELAYTENAIGCSCPDRTEGVCKTRAETGLDHYVALICFEGKWTAVMDGPCGLAPN